MTMATAFLAVPAAAQFNGGMDWVVTRTRVPTAIQCPGCNDHDNGGPQTEPSPAPVSAPALVYTPSKIVRKQNLARFIQESRARNPQGMHQMEPLFSQSDIIEQIGALIRPSGLRINNVADAYTVWWITAWEAVHQTDAGSSAAMYSAVKKQAARAILDAGKITAASITTKQEMAEALLVQAALIEASRDAAAGNASQLTAIARAVNQSARAMGMDLARMTLTDNGFSFRSGAPR